MELLHKLGKGLPRPILRILYLLSGFVPRDRRLWAFGCWHGKRFADNSRWLFLYCVREQKDSVKSVWISRDSSIVRGLKRQGLPAYHARSPLGLWYALRSGVHVFDAYSNDINFWASRGAIKVNLWHGIPLKKIERDIDIPSNLHYRIHHGTRFQKIPFAIYSPWLRDRYDLVISTSAYVSRLLASAFGLSRDAVAVTGFPRNDTLLCTSYDLPPGEQRLYHKLDSLRQKGKRVLAYMPTFRDNLSRHRQLPLDWGCLEDFLDYHLAVLVLKLHSYDRVPVPDVSQFRHIVAVPSEVDVHPFLRLVDVLITDYSSVYFDYLLLDRPVIFYAYDLEDYLSRRSMYVNYEDAVTGPTVKDFQGLLAALRQALTNTDSYSHERKTLTSIYHLYADDRSSERVYEEILSRFVQ